MKCLRIRSFIVCLMALYFPVEGFAQPLACSGLLSGFTHTTEPQVSEIEASFEALIGHPVSWQKVADLIDPGSAKKSRTGPLKRSDMLEALGYKISEVDGLERVLGHLAFYFLGISEGRYRDCRIPQRLHNTHLSLGAQKFSHYEILREFVQTKLLYLSPHPHIAARLSLLDDETRFDEVQKTLSKRLKVWLGHMTRLQMASFRPKNWFLAPKGAWKGLRYWILRRLLNGNFAHPALVEEQMRDISFVLESADLTLDIATVRLEDLSLSFQKEVVAHFKALAQTRGIQKVGADGARPVFQELRDFELADLKEVELEALRHTSLEALTMEERVQRTYPKELFDIRRRALEIVIGHFQAELEAARNRMRDLLWKDLETAYSKLQVLEARSNLTEAPAITAKALEVAVKDQRVLEWKSAARVFAQKFLLASEVAEVLAIRLDPKYETAFFSNPQIHLFGIEALLAAEALEAKRGRANREKVKSDFLERVASNPATWASRNPSALAAQFLAQAGQAGIFGYFADKPILRGGLTFVMAIAMFTAPFWGAALFDRPEDSPLYKLGASREALLAPKNFAEARWSFLVQFQDRGLSSADMKFIQRVLKRALSPSVPENIRERAKKLQSSGLMSRSVWLESRFPWFSRKMGIAPLENSFDQLGPEMAEFILLLRDLSQWEMSEWGLSLSSTLGTNAPPP